MVPVNRPNKDGKSSAEGEEGRPMIMENAHQAASKTIDDAVCPYEGPEYG